MESKELKCACAVIYLCKIIDSINASRSNANRLAHDIFIAYFKTVAKRCNNKTFEVFLTEADQTYNNIAFNEYTRRDVNTALVTDEKLCDEIITYYRYIYLGIDVPNKQITTKNT
jgi:hypothetical protein